MSCASPTFRSEMRDLRGTLDQLARAALMHPEEAERRAPRREGRAPGWRREPIRRDDPRHAVDGGPCARSGQGREPARGPRGTPGVRDGHRLGCTPEEREVIELAARLHEVKEIGRSQLGGIRSLREVGDVITGVRQLAEGRPRRRVRDATSLAAGSGERRERVRRGCAHRSGLRAPARDRRPGQAQGTRTPDCGVR